MTNLSVDNIKGLDNHKDFLVNKYDFKTIRIDCNYTNDRFNYIKRNIIKSDLNKYIDLTNIDWDNINEKASSNKTKEICDKYNNGMSIKDISNELCISVVTTRSHLKRGTELKWCNYIPKIGNKKRIKIVETGDIFNSVKECIDKSIEMYGVKFERSGISKVLNNKKHFYKGYTFKCID